MVASRKINMRTVIPGRRDIIAPYSVVGKSILQIAPCIIVGKPIL